MALKLGEDLHQVAIDPGDGTGGDHEEDKGHEEHEPQGLFGRPCGYEVITDVLAFRLEDDVFCQIWVDVVELELLLGIERQLGEVVLLDVEVIEGKTLSMLLVLQQVFTHKHFMLYGMGVKNLRDLGDLFFGETIVDHLTLSWPGFGEVA